MAGVRRSIYVADFETTTEIDDCRVWGWGIVNLKECGYIDDVVIGTTIDDFIDRVEQQNNIVYFHNLKFDGTFIIDWLYRNGFKHREGKHAGPGEFLSMISNMGQFYTITVTWGNGKKTEFRDSLKKLPYSVSEIAKAFNQKEAKGRINYKTKRPIGHNITNDEANYIAVDVLIVAAALKIQFDAGMKKLTVGSDSLAEYKKLAGASIFDKHFPVLSTYIDNDIRQSYRGGFTYASKRFTGKRVGKGRTYDVNSLYPSVMRNKLLPYGEPKYKPGFPETSELYPLFIASITFTAKLKKKHIPCIQVKGNTRFVGTEYQEKILEPTTMMVTSIDLELWKDHYDLEILSYNGSWMFKATRGMFNSYIDKWMEVKINSTGGMKALAKLHLNSLYG